MNGIKISPVKKPNNKLIFRVLLISKKIQYNIKINKCPCAEVHEVSSSFGDIFRIFIYNLETNKLYIYFITKFLI